MDKIKKKIYDKVKDNLKKIVIFLVVVNTFGTMWNPIKDLFGSNADQVNGIIKVVVRDAVKEIVEEAKTEYSLKLVEKETKDIRTSSEVDILTAKWKSDKDTPKLTALEIVSNSDLAKKKIKDKLYNEQIYRALMSY